MFSLLIGLTTLLAVSGWAYKKDYYSKAYDKTLTNLEKFRNLNRSVARGGKSGAIVCCISTKIILKAFWINTIQYFTKTVTRVGRNYHVEYVIEGRRYVMVVRPKKGPSPVLQVSNEQDEDVTEEILSFLGPEYNWHGKKLDPKFFGYETLTFEFADGSERTFTEEECGHITK